MPSGRGLGNRDDQFELVRNVAEDSLVGIGGASAKTTQFAIVCGGARRKRSNRDDERFDVVFLEIVRFDSSLPVRIE
jgi:hypothetical protein